MIIYGRWSDNDFKSLHSLVSKFVFGNHTSNGSFQSPCRVFLKKISEIDTLQIPFVSAIIVIHLFC